MKHKLRITAVLGTIALLILDSRTAIQGAEEGLQLCLHTLIPSLFPLIFATNLLLPCLSHFSNRDKLLCRLYHIPDGSPGLLLTGLLGGYPVGARAVRQASADGQISTAAAQRMEIFCNACGPAFIFGIGFRLFSNSYIPWVAWAIHILSGLLTAQFIPAGSDQKSCNPTLPDVTVQEGLHRSLRSMAQICSWVMILRVLIRLLEKWLLWCLPPLMQLICIGLLELSNGCTSLSNLQGEALRFIFFSGFVGFGGVCVGLQSIDISQKDNSYLYFPGKILQCNISILLAGIISFFFFGFESNILAMVATSGILIPICVFWLRKTQNKGRILSAVGV